MESAGHDTATIASCCRTRKNVNYTRARIIIHAAEGLANDESARRLDTRHEVVSRWRKRSFTERLPGLEALPRSGRPRSFPPEVVVQIKALACEFPVSNKYRWRGGAYRRSPAMSCKPGWWPASATRRSGAGCTKTPFDLGNIVAGFFRAFRTWPLKPVGCWICVREFGRTNRCARMSLCFRLTKRPASKHGRAFIPPRAWAYLATWDVHLAKVFGRCEAQSGMAPFDRLVEQVMGQSPYKSARRVFWIVDKGSFHRGQRAVARLQNRYANLTLV